MKNNYEIRGEVTAIFINSPKYGNIETLIDTVDLERVCMYTNAWYAHKTRTGKGIYIKCNIKEGKGKYKNIMMHRFIMDFPVGLEIDHINHDTLDNRKSLNLRGVSHKENKQNITEAQNNSISGILGVGFHQNRWRAQITVNGRNIYLGVYHTKEEAVQASKEAKKKYHPCSQGKIS